MTKAKNNSPQAVRNRNNRKRGASFEKKVAEVLNMEIVPYSGSNARFGWSDVRDSEQKDKAIWMGECKNITVGADDTSVTLERIWFTKNHERAYGSKATPFLAFMIAGKPQKYVVLDETVMTFLATEMGYPNMVADHTFEYKKKSHNTVNLIIPLTDLKLASGNGVVKFRNDGDTTWYYMMSIDSFHALLKETKLHCKYIGGDK